MYLQQRHRNQTVTTVKCNQLQWLPPSSPASRGRYRAGREGDPRFAMSPRWIFPTVILNRSLHLKYQRRGGESQASRSVSGKGLVEIQFVCVVCLKMHVYTERHNNTGSMPSDFTDFSGTLALTSVSCCSQTSCKIFYI